MAVIVHEDKCDACSSCVEVCPTDAIHVEETAIVDNDECIDCGACVDECPSGALELE